jgi:hypothetical protein
VTLDPDEQAGGTLTWDTSGESTGTYDVCVVTDDREACLSVEVQSATTVPSSVTHQYRAEDFASPWPDNVGSADMSVSGLSSSTFGNGEDSVAGDGTDDIGTASGPETLYENETWGIAITFSASGLSNGGRFWGYADTTVSPARGFQVGEAADSTGTNGKLEYDIFDDSGNELRAETDNAYDDGNPHLLVINKNGNSTVDINFYVDDMSTTVASTSLNNQNFDHTDVTATQDMGFFARNRDSSNGGADLHVDADIGLFEFNSDPYNQSERTDLKSRRPEV